MSGGASFLPCPTLSESAKLPKVAAAASQWKSHRSWMDDWIFDFCISPVRKGLNLFWWKKTPSLARFPWSESALCTKPHDSTLLPPQPLRANALCNPDSAMALRLVFSIPGVVEEEPPVTLTWMCLSICAIDVGPIPKFAELKRVCAHDAPSKQAPHQPPPARAGPGVLALPEARPARSHGPRVLHVVARLARSARQVKGWRLLADGTAPDTLQHTFM